MKRAYILLLSIITVIFAVTGCTYTNEKENLTFSGTVEADEVNVNSEIQGKITGIFAKEGDAVKKGDLLVQLDDTSLKLQEALAKAGVEKARAQLDDVLAGSRDESIKAADAGVAEASLDMAREMVEKSRIFSPLDGTVLYSNFRPGEVVFPGSPIMTILDLKNLWVNIYIPEKDLKLVKLHQSLDVRYEDKVVKGEIIFISPQGEFTPRNIQAKEERQNVVYKVKVKLPYSDILKPGMEVDVVLPAGEVK